jgi:hypothetical protein
MINKSYNVTADDRLSIDNQFGNVVVSTWDEPRITVDIEIGAKAPSDEKAKDIMDKINVEDSNNDHNIRFKTEVNNIHNANGNNVHRDRDEGGDRSFYIDYVIHMPDANRLIIENSFGKTEVPAFKGPVSLTSKFGSLSTGRLSNVDLIDVEFGRGYVSSITNGKVVLNFDHEARIGNVSGNVRINCEFSQNVEVGVMDNIQELSVYESYSEVKVVVDSSLSAEFDVHSSFGHFRNESDFAISERKEDEGDYGPHFDKDYSGKAGDGKAKIKIKSSFGTVRLSFTGDRERYRDRDRDKKDKNKNKDKDDDDNDDDDRTTAN